MRCLQLGYEICRIKALIPEKRVTMLGINLANEFVQHLLRQKEAYERVEGCPMYRITEDDIVLWAELVMPIMDGPFR